MERGKYQSIEIEVRMKKKKEKGNCNSIDDINKSFNQ